MILLVWKRDQFVRISISTMSVPRFMFESTLKIDPNTLTGVRVAAKARSAGATPKETGAGVCGFDIWAMRARAKTWHSDVTRAGHPSNQFPRAPSPLIPNTFCGESPTESVRKSYVLRAACDGGEPTPSNLMFETTPRRGGFWFGARERITAASRTGRLRPCWSGVAAFGPGLIRMGDAALTPPVSNRDRGDHRCRTGGRMARCLDVARPTRRTSGRTAQRPGVSGWSARGTRHRDRQRRSGPSPRYSARAAR